ncbi:MAG: MFS transporter [Planctomycetota bacterium]
MTQQDERQTSAEFDWRRNYFAVWPSMLLVSMGLMAILPSLPLYIEERFGVRDADELRMWTGAIWGGAPLAAACMGPFWGVLGDRVGRKPMALRALIGIAITTGLMPLASSPAYLLAARVLQGLVAGYIAPSMALVTAKVPPDRQGRTIGSLQVALAAGLLAGPWVGAELIRITGSREVLFYLTSSLALLASLPIIFFAREDRGLIRKHRRESGSMRSEIKQLLAGRLLWALLLCIFMLRFGQQMVEAYIALWVRELGPLMFLAPGGAEPAVALERSIALPFTILAVAQIFFTTAWGRLADKYGPLRCLAVLALGLGSVLAGTGFLTSIEGYMLMRCAAAVFMAGSMTLAYSAIGKRVQNDQRSLAYSLAQSCIQFGLSLGPLFGGFMSQWTGIAGLFFMASFCLLAVGCTMLILRKRTLPMGAQFV